MTTSSPRVTRPALLEREQAIAAVRDALDAAGARRGEARVLTGPPGIGKTRMLEAAAALAAERGMRTLRARGIESETGYPFGGVLQLFERHVGGAELTGAAGLARPVFEGRFLTGGGGPVAPAVHGLFWLTVSLAADVPLAILVDDVHALDNPTLEYLAYLLRRIDELPVALIVTSRPIETLARRAVSELVYASEVGEVPLRPLSAAAVGELVRESFGPAADEAFCDACARVSGGNPFLLGEALRALAAERTPPTEDGARRLVEIEPQAVARAVLLRLARLGGDAIALAKAGAVVGGGTPLELVAEIAQMPVERALVAADALSGVGVLSTVDPVEFTHALVATAVLGDLAAAQRRLLHLRAATVMSARHLPAERIAAQLLEAPATGSEQHLRALADAAAHALEAGMAEMAARLLERALAEQPGPEARVRLLLELARAELGIDPARSSGRIAEAMRLGADGHDAAALELELGRALYVSGRHDEAARTFLAAAERLDPADSLARELQGWFVSASVFVEPLRARGLELAARLAADPPQAPTVAERGVLAQLGVQAVAAGRPLREVRELAERAWGGGALLHEETCNGYQWMHVTAVHLWGGDYEEAARIVGEVLEDARRRGSVMAFATASYIRASARLWQGRLLEGLADIERTLDIHRRYGWEMFLGAAQYVHAEIRLECGEIDAAADAVELANDARFADSAEGALLLFARGRTRLVRGDASGALEDLLAAHTRARATGINPIRLLPVWGPIGEARARVGDLDGARAAFEEGVRLARAAEVPGVLSRTLVARARTEPREAALETLGEAVAVVTDGQSRLDHARAQLELGICLRRAGRRADALAALRPAFAAAHELGAVPLVDVARQELAVLGSRPRRAPASGAASLTASELRTARMAAEGMTNRAIAEALFVTPKTVEYHLRNAFMKLGITSRRELEGLLPGTPEKD